MPSSSRLRLALSLPLALAAHAALGAEPPAEPAAAAGPVYKNAELGLTLSAPKGWTMTAEAAPTSSWVRLAQFAQPGGGLEVTLSRRPRSAPSLAALEEQVKREWEADKTMSVTALATVEPTTLRPLGLVRVEANQTRKSGPARPGATPTPPVIWQLEAAYVLAAGAEVRVQAEGPLAAFGTARAQVRALIDSLTLASAPKGPEGAGTYRDDLRGFSLSYPAGYGVVVPQRERHLVEFAPVSPDLPVFGVYLLVWDQGVSQDVERLLKHYKDERGGEATSRVEDVAGQPGAIVTARVTESGRDTTIVMAVVKRGNDLFRLRASMPTAASEAGRAAFKAFVGSFTLGAAAR